jgi:hypothetical protein
MTYNKPSIEELGKAIFVIQGEKGGPVTEAPLYAGTPNVPTPAYDLDD